MSIYHITYPKDREPISREDRVKLHKRARALAQGAREAGACSKRWFPDRIVWASPQDLAQRWL